MTQVDFVLCYEKNKLGVTREVYEFDFETNIDFNCEVPAEVTEAVGNYDSQLELYHNMMR